MLVSVVHGCKVVMFRAWEHMLDVTALCEHTIHSSGATWYNKDPEQSNHVQATMHMHLNM